MIELKNINKESLVDFNLTINDEESIAILGDNSAEKSRLLRIISLAEKADNGTVLVDGKDVEELSPPAKLRLKNDSFSTIFATGFFLPTLTVFDAVTQPIAHRGITMDNHKRALALLETVGLKQEEHTLAKDLSAFDKKKLGIATAFIQEPLVILADNPTADLDDQQVTEYFNLLQQVTKQEGASLVIATDNQNIADLCNRTVNI